MARGSTDETGRIDTEILVIGGGVAGMRAALQLAENYKVLLVSKASIKSSASWQAQGGIAAALDKCDSFESHIADTLDAGAGLCDRKVVETVIAAAPNAIHSLIDLGVPFDADENTPKLTLEGGHSHKRILHVFDRTGKAICRKLAAQVAKHSNIKVYEDAVVIDLINAADMGLSFSQIVGAYVYHGESNSYSTIAARATILATGGASKAYLYSNNVSGASGDGIAMAWRAGAVIANLEFNQFHPTYLYHAHAGGVLISEAFRGEGAILRLPDGTAFASIFDQRGELAPRDIVARTIDYEMKRLGLDCVYLDISHKPAEWIQKRFPSVHKRCKKLDIDITTQPIPVVPAAHYTCGGVLTDLAGQTNLIGLFAIGETACTGLHGANRLASNSLLECLVFADRTASWIHNNFGELGFNRALPKWDASKVKAASEDVLINHNWDELRRAMWNYVGIVRNDLRLERAKKRLNWLSEEVHDYYIHHKLGADLLELRNLVQVADLIIESAKRRKESRGLHYTLDYPELLPEATNTCLRGPL